MTLEREYSLNVGGTVLPIPCFFPSICSIKTNLSPLEHLRVLVAVDHPLFLISAYDIHHATIEERAAIEDLLSQSYAKKRTILLDSGNYEAYWMRDNTWIPAHLATILGKQPFHVAFCYDNQCPPATVDAVVDDVEYCVLREQASSRHGTILPIVHASRQILTEVIRRLVERLHPLVLAVPERALGDGIFARAEMVRRIRCALGQVGYYCPLHLLGTGNPLSILIYAMCGADSFDGLEWYQTVVDHTSGRLFHLHHWDFFSDQTPMGGLKDLPYHHLVLAHNLIFYRDWMNSLRNALRENKVLEFATTYLPERTLDRIHQLLTEIL